MSAERVFKIEANCSTSLHWSQEPVWKHKQRRDTEPRWVIAKIVEVIVWTEQSQHCRSGKRSSATACFYLANAATRRTGMIFTREIQQAAKFRRGFGWWIDLWLTIAKKCDGYQQWEFVRDNTKGAMEWE